MTPQEKAREEILRRYERIERQYIHEQESSGMLMALQHEKNEALVRLAEREAK